MVRLMGYWGQPFATCDMSGLFWGDTDTPEDYQAITQLIEEGQWKGSMTALYPDIGRLQVDMGNVG